MAPQRCCGAISSNQAIKRGSDLFSPIETSCGSVVAYSVGYNQQSDRMASNHPGGREGCHMHSIVYLVGAVVIVVVVLKLVGLY